MAETDPKSVQDLTNVMSTRIDDLEKNIGDLMTQAGVEEIEAAPEKAKDGQVHKDLGVKSVRHSGAADFTILKMTLMSFSSCSSQRFTAAFLRSTRLTGNTQVRSLNANAFHSRDEHNQRYRHTYFCSLGSELFLVFASFLACFSSVFSRASVSFRASIWVEYIWK
ncbi:Heat shock factor-binding protein 1 [Liparis tanakae]|uniref:Heat shock factor-binding protein 1 n=1 Tax=Liparis tanakae TaxID=230148 RepID=A0A4Z2J4V1_9TELE|nr:Heat shock factor-binding protein 1 [Liparis tanakae]